MGFLTPVMVKWIVIGVLIVAAFASGWVKGNNHGTQKLTDYVKEQLVEATRIAGVRTIVTERIVTTYLEKKGATERVVETVEKEVLRYAETNPGNMCIGAEWLRLHDYAATHANPKPPAVPGGALRTTGGSPGNAYSLAGVGYGGSELRPPPQVRRSDGSIAGLGY